MPRTKVAKLAIAELTHESLREEAEEWAVDETVEAARAVYLPDRRSEDLQGFYRVNAGIGMVVWGDSENDMLSDWITCDCIEDMFEIYLRS